MLHIIKHRARLIHASVIISMVLSICLFGAAQADEQPEQGNPPNTIYLPSISGENTGIPDAGLEQLALQLVADRQEIAAENLAVVGTVTIDYSSQGVVAFVIEVADSRDGGIYNIALDRYGQELDLEVLEAVAAGEAVPGEPSQVAAVDAQATQALAYIAGQQAIPSDQLTIAYRTSSHLPLTGVNLTDFKVASRDGRIFGVSYDAATGAVADAAAAVQQELKLRRDTYGAVEPSLYNRLQLNAAERIPVAIWVAMEDPGTLMRGANPNLNALTERVHRGASAGGSCHPGARCQHGAGRFSSGHLCEPKRRRDQCTRAITPMWWRLRRFHRTSCATTMTRPPPTAIPIYGR